MSRGCLLLLLLLLLLSRRDAADAFFFNGPSSSAAAVVPKSLADRDARAINAVKAAIASPRDPSLPLVECEFPALAALNKLGDGSLRSAQEAEKSNLAFVGKLVKALAPPPFVPGTRPWLLVSASSSNAFSDAASRAAAGAATLRSLREGVPSSVGPNDVCVLVTPSGRTDYEAARVLATRARAVVLVNGFAKDAKSVPGRATMAYYLKPLTYNSRVAGFLVRSWPGPWTTIDAASSEVLSTRSDEDVLVRGTNTPDLRESGREVQRSVDQRAARERGR